MLYLMHLNYIAYSIHRRLKLYTFSNRIAVMVPSEDNSKPQQKQEKS